jgi:SAM-dependent methyltransferase
MADGASERVPLFYSRSGLHVDTYDALFPPAPGGDEVAFYRRLAGSVDGAVLELGAGTGRVALPLAAAGVTVVGLDRSKAMLAIAERRRRAASSDVRRRVRFIEGDMTDLRLRRRFGMVYAPGRVFMFLHEPATQRAALEGIHRNLRPGGILAIDVFDPLLDRCAPGDWEPEERGVVTNPETGNRVRITAVSRTNDPLTQRLTERWRFSELDAADRVVREEYEDLVLRWTYRHEMRYLLELTGFDEIVEYGDYAGSPPAYGQEQIWVARRPAGRRRRRHAARPRP